MKHLLRPLFCLGLAWAMLSCSTQRYEGKVLAVRLDKNAGETMGARLVLIDPDKPGKEAKELFTHLHSAAAPSLSHDARYLYFQAREFAGEPWQIWVADLKKGRVKQISNFPENCTDPAALPGKQVVFCREHLVQGTKTSDLWKMDKDGSGAVRLTYDPSMNTAPSVLLEGRVLYLSKPVLPVQGEARLMIMRPDGTKSELYNAGEQNLLPGGQGNESPDGHIYFPDREGGLARVLHRRPLHSFESIGSLPDGLLKQVHACQDGTLLLAFRQQGDEYSGIYRFSPDQAEVPRLIQGGASQYLDPVAVEKTDPRPRILPSEVDPARQEAQLMVQDINHSMLPVHADLVGDSLASHLKIILLDGASFVVEAKSDGSVYVKMDPRRPFRVETLNRQGEVVRGPSDWIFLHPNERRACTGCHVNPELAPRNYQPHAIKEDPVDLSTRRKESGTIQ